MVALIRQKRKVEKLKQSETEKEDRHCDSVGSGEGITAAYGIFGISICSIFFQEFRQLF